MNHMRRRKQDHGWGRVRIRPSYSTQVHLKRRARSVDWRFLVSLVTLIALIAVAVLLLG
jgi:hypothetical protein